MGIYNSSLKNNLENKELVDNDKEIIHTNSDNNIDNQNEKGQEDVEEQKEKQEKQEEKEENININDFKEFKEYDENNDGKITWKEFEKEFENKYGRKMDRNDLWEFLANNSDGDTSVSLNEWKLYNRCYGYD